MISNPDLITVVVPVYGVEKYLDRCVESVVNQTYTNLEIILVDDGSPDNCPAMCDAWAKKDSRIKVIHKKNGGLSDARNAGIDAATGKYIMFVDSDDYIALPAVEVLYRSIIEDKVDVAIGVIEISDEGKEDKHLHGVHDKKILCNGYEAIYKIFTYSSAIGAPNRLYNIDIVKANKFKVGVLHEDVYFTTDVFSSSDSLRVSFLPIISYFYRRRADSIMGKAFNNSPKKDMIIAYSYLFQIIDTKFGGFKEYNDYMKICSIQSLSSNTIVPHIYSSEEYDQYVHDFMKDNWNFISSHNFSGNYKLRLKLFYYFPRLYRFFKIHFCL